MLHDYTLDVYFVLIVTRYAHPKGTAGALEPRAF